MSETIRLQRLGDQGWETLREWPDSQMNRLQARESMQLAVIPGQRRLRIAIGPEDDEIIIGSWPDRERGDRR